MPEDVVFSDVYHGADYIVEAVVDMSSVWSIMCCNFSLALFQNACNGIHVHFAYINFLPPSQCDGTA